MLPILFISLSSEVGPGGALHNWHSAVVAKNGAIYAVPFSASFALKIEFSGDSVQAGIPGLLHPITLSATTWQAKQLGTLGNSIAKWSQAILSSNGDVYGVPWSAEKVLKIRPQTDEAPGPVMEMPWGYWN